MATTAVRVPRRKGYNPAQDALYAATSGPMISPEESAAADTRVWNWHTDVVPWQRQLQELLDSAPLQDIINTKPSKKHQKVLDGLLCCAAAAGRLDAVQLLLQSGAQPLCSSSYGISASKPTALHWAAAYRQVAAFTLLQQAIVLRHGRDTIPTILGLMPVSPLDLLASDMSVSRLLDVQSHSLSLITSGSVSDPDDDAALEPHSAQSPADPQVREVFSWNCTSLLFSSGHSSNGTLGRGNSGSSSWPKRVSHGLGACGILDLACSQYVSACVASDGRLFTWGLGTLDRLGHLDRPTSLNLPRQLVDPSAPTTRFVQVALSSNHGAAVTAEGGLYTWGSGAFGQLGIAPSDIVAPESATEVSNPFVRLKALRSECFRYVACGDRHTVAVTSSGRLYTFGAGSDGQLGHGPPAKDEQYPRLLTSLLNTSVQDSLVAVGPRHTCVVTTSRDIYLFGFGNPTPRRIQFSFGYPSLKSGFRIKSISSCPSSSLTRFSATSVDEVLILTEKGEVYSYLESVDTHPVLIHEPLPQHPRLIRVNCSEDANYAVSEMGVLFKFSPRTAKALGAPILERIPLIQRVEQVCASRSHALYKVTGPLSPLRQATLEDDHPNPFVENMVNLLLSSRDCDTIVEACEPDQQLHASFVSSASPRGLLCHSWVLARVPAFATLLDHRSNRSTGTMCCICIPVANPAVLRILLQWVYTDRVWTTRSPPPPTTEIVIFRHEQHLKSLQALARQLDVPAFAACVTGGPSVDRSAAIAAHLRSQFVSPLFPEKHGLILDDMVRIILTREGSSEIVGFAGAHKCILTLQSEYFSTMLDGNWSESDKSEIRLESVSPVSLHLLLSFMYSYQLLQTEDDREKYWNPQVAFELLALSDELLLPHLARAVELELGSLLKPDSASRLLLAASTYRAEDLLRTASNYISVNSALLLRLDALSEATTSLDVLSQLQERVNTMWSHLPLNDVTATDASTAVRFVSDVIRRHHLDQSRPAKGSPSSLERASPKFESPAATTLTSSLESPTLHSLATSPNSPSESISNPIVDTRSAPNFWSKVESKSPSKPLSEILKEEADQRSAATVRTRTGNPWATSPQSNTPKPKMHWAEPERKKHATPSPASPKGSIMSHKASDRVSTSPKPDSTFSLSQLLPKTSPKSPVPAAWSAKPSRPVQASTSPADFPALITSPPPAKASLKDIIQEQQRQIELTRHKARPLKEILEEEAILAEHIRVEEYYAKLKQQDTDVQSSSVSKPAASRGRQDKQRRNRSKHFQPPS